MAPETSDLDPPRARDPADSAEPADAAQAAGREGDGAGAAGEGDGEGDGEAAVASEAEIPSLGDEEIEELDEDDFELHEEEAAAAPPPMPPPPPAPPPAPDLAAITAPAKTPAIAAEGADVPVDDEPVEDDTAIELPSALDVLIERRDAGAFGQRAAELQSELEAARSAGDKRRAGALAYELGELYEARLDDEAGAVKAYGQALQADPSLRANLWAIRRVFYRRGLWPNLVKLIGAEVRFAASDAERADLQVEKAHVQEDRLADIEEARRSYEQALAFDAASVPALLGLERLALVQNDVETLERVWRALADASRSPERKLPYLLDLARLRAARGNEGALAAAEVLAEAAALGVEGERVARERERMAESHGDVEELTAALEAQIARAMAQISGTGEAAGEGGAADPAATAGAGADLRRKVVALRRRQAHAVLRRGDDPERAWGYLQEALALAPGEPLVLADLADIAEQLGKFVELAEVVAGWESQEADPVRALSLSLRRADALLRSGRHQQARELLESLAASAPGYLPVLAMRERDALERSDWRALAEVYDAAAEAARGGSSFGPGVELAPDPAAAAAAYLAAADVYAHLAGDAEAARVRCERALDAVPGYPPAVEALAGLHERAGRLEDAAQLLELQSETGEPEQRIHHLERLCRIYEELGQVEERLSALRRLVELDPEQNRLRFLLEEALDELGKSEERAALLADLAERIVDPDRRAAVLLEAARVRDEELDDPGGAADLYRVVLEIWPQDRYARSALVALLRRAGRFEELVAERRAEAAQLPDGPAAARALREAAAVLANRLGKSAEAAEIYSEVCERLPGDRAALRGLVEAREAAGRGGGASAPLCEALEKEAEAATEPAEQARALFRLARAREEAGALEEAIECYRRAAETGSLLSAVAYTDLACRGGAPDEIAESLEELGRHVASGEILEEIGWLCAAALDDPDRALDAFRQAIEAAEEPGVERPGALLGSALVQAKRGDVVEVGEALARLAGAIEGDYAQASLLLRAGIIAAVQGDEALAGDRVARALAAAPGDAGTLVVAAEMLALPTPSGDAEGLERQAELYAARAALTADPEARDDWQLDRAETLEVADRLGEAAAVVMGVLESRPDNVRALQAMRRICRLGGDRASLARASVALARVLGDGESKLALLREAALIFDTELSEVEPAVAVYRRILVEDPGALEFARLHEILREHDDVGGLYELLTERLNHFPAGPERVPLLLERARLRERSGDLKGAHRDLDALLKLEPRNLPGQFEQAQILIRLDQPEKAAEILEEYARAESDPRRRAEAELTLSQILSESMGDVAGAIEQLEHVVRQAPSDVAVRERLVSLLLKAGEHERAIREIREVSQQRAGAGERARDELRIAALYRDDLGDPEKARAALERARQLDPLNVDAVRELAGMVSGKARRQVLAAAASDVRAAIADAPARPPLYERLAVVAGWLEDGPGRHFALTALEALGALPDEHRDLVDAYRRELPSQPGGSEALTDELWRTRLAHPQAGGFSAELFAIVSDAVAKERPHEPAELGFARGDRVKFKELERRHAAVAAAAQALGVGEFEAYVSAEKKRFARAIGSDKPVLFLSADVAAADTPASRFLLGRALAHLRGRTGSLPDLKPRELELVFAAAAQVAGVAPLPAQLARVEEGGADKLGARVRFLQKALGRRERKNLALAASRFSEIEDPARWHQATLATADRTGLLLAGDLQAALGVLEIGGARALADRPEGLSLLSWAVGDGHLTLRRFLELNPR